MGAAIVMTTVEASSDLPRRLIEERLAGCVQEVPITSTYRWDGEITRAAEVLLLIKTADDRGDDVVRWLDRNHPYDVPEIIMITEADVWGPYLGWLTDMTRPAG